MGENGRVCLEVRLPYFCLNEKRRRQTVECDSCDVSAGKKGSQTTRWTGHRILPTVGKKITDLVRSEEVGGIPHV